MFIAKQDLLKVPFHLVQEAVGNAVALVEEEMLHTNKEKYDAFIAQKYAEWVDVNEAPYEGNFTDEYPFREPDPSKIAAAKKTARQEAFKEIALKLGLKAKAAWLLPQVTAYIAKMPLPRNDKGLIDPKSFVQQNFGVDDWHKGLWIYCTVFQRGLIVPSQTSAEMKNYSAIVPLLMMPFKKFNNIKYSEWDRDNLHLVVDENLCEAMLCTDKIEMSIEEIIALRDHGLTVSTGGKAGDKRNPMTYHKLYKLTGTPLNDIPWLAQDMVTQIWAAHPANRTNLMILDYLDWDNMPEPLIKTELFEPSKKPTKTKVVELPWD